MIKQVERVLTLFRDDFHCGMRLQFIDLEKLKAKYESEFGEEVPFSDDVLKSFIQNNGFETEPNKFYHIDNLLCRTSVAEIESFIAEQNAYGAKRIWIAPLYNYFRDKLGLAVDAELLVKILQKLGAKSYRIDGKGFICYKSAQLDGIKDECCQAVAHILERESAHLTFAEIQQKLPAYPPLNSIKGLRLTNSPYIIELFDGSFAHIDCVYITDAEIEGIKRIIETEMHEAGSAGRESVHNRLEEEIPSIFENNAVYGDTGIWKAIASRLSDEYIVPMCGQIQRIFG